MGYAPLQHSDPGKDTDCAPLLHRSSPTETGGGHADHPNAIGSIWLLTLPLAFVTDSQNLEIVERVLEPMPSANLELPGLQA